MMTLIALVSLVYLDGVDVVVDVDVDVDVDVGVVVDVGVGVVVDQMPLNRIE